MSFQIYTNQNAYDAYDDERYIEYNDDSRSNTNFDQNAYDSEEGTEKIWV